MKHTARLRAVALLTLMLVVTACQGSTPAASGGVPSAATTAAPASAAAARTDVRIGSTIPCTTLDPMIDSVGCSELFAIFDQLIYLTSDQKPAPGLATEWKMVDDLTWEFKLRNDVTFHNGDKFTSADVKFNFDRILDPATKSRQLPVYYSRVAEIVIIDDYTFQMKTKVPWPGMANFIPFMRVAPAKYFQEVGAEAFAEKPIGSGPYKFVQWVRDSHMDLEAYDGYWRGAAAIKKVRFKTIVDPTARLAQLLSGEVDMIDRLPPKDAATVDAKPELQVTGVRGMNAMFVGINTFVEPFDDVRVRQAMNHAVNWDLIIKEILQGHAFKNATSTGARTQGYDPNLKPYAYDPAKAKELLAAAGFPNGFETTLDGPIGRYNADKEVAEAIAGQLGEVGIKVTYRGAEFQQFFTRMLSNAELPMATGERARAPEAVPGLFLIGCSQGAGTDFDNCNRLYFDSTVRAIYFNNPDLDKKLAAQAAILDPAAREAAQKALLKEIYDLAPWIFGYDDEDLWGHVPNLNVVLRPNNWVDPYLWSWK